MAKKIEENQAPNVFEGFEALSKSLLGGPGGKDPDENIPYIEPEDLKKKESEEEETEKNKTKLSKEEDEEIEEINENEEEESEEDSEEEDESSEEDEGDDSEEKESDTEFEVEVTSFLKDRLSEELGWELDEDNEFKSIKDVVDYMKLLVEESSKPKYFSDEVKALDEYVKNGGDVDKYFKEVYKDVATGIDYDTLDISKESNQRLVIKELLQEKGYSSDRIQRTLDRYEKAETLGEEAEDAVELLKEYKKDKQEKLLESQKNLATEQINQQQKFYENVQTSIKSMENVRGIKISSKEREELLDYIFKPSSDGLTNYQKDYMSDIKNLIESAYFTKRGDALIQEAKKKGSSDAYKEFHQKLKANKGKRSKNAGSLESGSESDLLLSSLSKNLLNKV